MIFPSDSIGHMILMSKIEDEFKITLETDDIIFYYLRKVKKSLKINIVEFK